MFYIRCKKNGNFRALRRGRKFGATLRLANTISRFTATCGWINLEIKSMARRASRENNIKQSKREHATITVLGWSV